MIIIDRLLEEREKSGSPICVGLVGAGFMAKGAVIQIMRYSQGFRLSAIANRTPSKAVGLYKLAGAEDIAVVNSQKALDKRTEQGKPTVTPDALAICRSPHIDVVVELTGAVEFGAHVVMETIRHGKHVVIMNAELDGTIGPILKQYADKRGVIYTNAAGDQPGVEMNLYRYVKGMGIKPVVCGNIKGLHDPYRTPTTQKAFAEKWGQNPSMVTSFADGTKISFEQAVVANATGMRVAKRGMHGYTMEGMPIERTVEVFDINELKKIGGIVDYVVGARPNGGVFVLGTMDDPIQKHYLDLYKVGKGPLYCFYIPYHLCHFELPTTIARTVLLGDATIAPIGKPMVEVVATAKKDLSAGEAIDYLGGYTVYGLAENADIARKENLLPIGLSEGLKLNKSIAKDHVITLKDIHLQSDRLSWKLWQEQCEAF